MILSNDLSASASFSEKGEGSLFSKRIDQRSMPFAVFSPLLRSVSEYRSRHWSRFHGTAAQVVFFAVVPCFSGVAQEYG